MNDAKELLSSFLISLTASRGRFVPLSVCGLGHINNRQLLPNADYERLP
jgi:hypothetical protein